MTVERPEEGGMEDFASAAALACRIAECTTKGEILAMLLDYRKEVRADALSQAAKRPAGDTEELRLTIAHYRTALSHAAVMAGNSVRTNSEDVEGWREDMQLLAQTLARQIETGPHECGTKAGDVSVGLDRMEESVNRVSWWVAIRVGSRVEHIRPYRDPYRNRGEYEVARLKHLLGQGPRPSILDFPEPEASEGGTVTEQFNSGDDELDLLLELTRQRECDGERNNSEVAWSGALESVKTRLAPRLEKPANATDALRSFLAACDEAEVDRAAMMSAMRDITTPEEPSLGLLMSMAIRFDHGLAVPGYYDAALFKQPGQPSHLQRVDATISTMRQLYEEVSGRGFYALDKDAWYARLAAAPEATRAGGA